MKEFKLFNKNMINPANAAQVAAYNHLIKLCTIGRDTDGIEDAAIDMLLVTPEADYIGFKCLGDDTLEIATDIKQIDLATQKEGVDPHELAEKICIARGIEPDFWGGHENGYIHINEGSRRSREGYTLGYCF